MPASLPMPFPTRSRPRPALVLAAALMLTAAFAATARAQVPVAPDPVAAANQIELGEQWFRAACLECHATGGLSNSDFRLKWNGRSAFDLMESIRSTMPESAPGSLTQGTYVAVVAYLIRTNGMPVGTNALPADSAGLSTIKLMFAPASSSPRR
jgi:mono/diheme cytochrome c family protein